MGHHRSTRDSAEPLRPIGHAHRAEAHLRESVDVVLLKEFFNVSLHVRHASRKTKNKKRKQNGRIGRPCRKKKKKKKGKKRVKWGGREKKKKKKKTSESVDTTA